MSSPPKQFIFYKDIMMRKQVIAVLMILFFMSCQSGDSLTIYLIGDSTMSDKPDPQRNPERGWGQMLPQFFSEQVTIKNFAVNGRSTKSFIDEGRWTAVRSEMKRGDYVFIQFGHNDQKIKDSLRYTNPLTAYRYNLIQFVTEAKDKGAIPVLFSPIVRRKFNEYGVLTDTHGLYPLIMRQVATELNVPFVDLHYKSERLVISKGPEQSKELYLWIGPGRHPMYPEGKQDDTHFSVTGATEMARLAVEGVNEQGLEIVNYFKPNVF
jgi:lysophospholipase L1-like esterase